MVISYSNWPIIKKIQEPEQLVKWIKNYMKDEYRVDRDIILMGGSNIDSFDSELYKAISTYGLSASDAILQFEFGSNLANNKRYDQLLHHPTATDSVFSVYGGIFDFYKGTVRCSYRI